MGDRDRPSAVRYAMYGTRKMKSGARMMTRWENLEAGTV